jgi:hypothetical protein
MDIYIFHWQISHFGTRTSASHIDNEPLINGKGHIFLLVIHPRYPSSSRPSTPAVPSHPKKFVTLVPQNFFQKSIVHLIVPIQARILFESKINFSTFFHPIYFVSHTFATVICVTHL